MRQFSLTIVGGGLVGLAVAREFSSILGAEEVLVLERHQHLGQEQSGRSSEVVHSGIYQEGLKAELCVRGNQLLREFCQMYSVPLRTTKKLIVARTPSEVSTLEKMLATAQERGIPQVEMIDGHRVRQLEPAITSFGALHCGTSGVIDSGAYLHKLYDLCRDKRALVALGANVVNITPASSGFTLQVKQGEETYRVQSTAIINSAGLWADDVARLVNPENNYEIIPVKGDYAVLPLSPPHPELSISRCIYTIPRTFLENGRTFYDLDLHLVPREGSIWIGPAIKPVISRDDYRHDTPLQVFRDSVHRFFPGIKTEYLSPGHTGILAEERTTHDFIIARDSNHPACLHLVGMESPGLTAALAVAEYILHQKNPLE